MREELRNAIQIVKDGGVIIYPTDTACGIGCRIDTADAIERVFTIKGRDTSKATPVLFSSIEMITQYVSEISTDVKEKLMEQFWPGALTIILSAQKEKVDEMIRGGGETIGTRIPNFPEITTLIEEVGVPIIGTSANFSGEPSSFSTKELSQELVSLVDYVLPGDCTVKEASTVIDCTDLPWNIVRSGAITIQL